MAEKDSKKMLWYNISLMGFVSVWGFGNVVNNFATQGLAVVFSWVMIMALYFIPYALMVGELGSVFRDGKGGVSTWIHRTYTPLLAFLAGWTYWVVHIPYLAQKPQTLLVALSWVISPNGDLANLVKTANPLYVQLIVLFIFLSLMYVASRGVNSIKSIGGIAGTSVFVMSLLFIVLGLTAPALLDTPLASDNMNSINTYIPEFNFNYLTTLSMLIFAVGGAEKIAPYVNETKDPSKNFPKGMLVLAGMVTVCALLGSIVMGIMFNANDMTADLLMNGQYYAFKMLGQYYGLGNTFVVIYALANVAAQLSAIVISIDAPLRVFLGEAGDRYVPKKLSKVNDKGIYVNGYIVTAILVGVIIIVPALGIGNTNELYNWLLRLNSVVMPMRYMWVFLAYIGLKKMTSGTGSSYTFIKNNKIGVLVGTWCLSFTAFACILGMFPKEATLFQIIMNVVTPVILIGLGMILPMIAKKTNK